MADDGVWTTNAMIAAKAGANVNTTAITAAETDKYVLQVESFVNVATRFNWSDAWGSTPATPDLNVDVAWILGEITSNMCAMYAIQYDMSGFSSRKEAETMLDVLREGALRGISILRDLKQQDFMNGA